VQDFAQKLGVGIDPDHQMVGPLPRQPIRESAISGTEVDVNLGKGAGALSQSSTVDPALVLSFDQVHSRALCHLDGLSSNGRGRPDCSSVFENHVAGKDELVFLGSTIVGGKVIGVVIPELGT